MFYRSNRETNSISGKLKSLIFNELHSREYMNAIKKNHGLTIFPFPHAFLNYRLLLTFPKHTKAVY